MLIPVLELTGITDTGNQNSKALDIVAAVWGFLGISFTLFWGLFLYLVLVLIYALLDYIKSLLDSQVVQEYKQTLRDELFLSVIRAEWSFIKKSKNTHIFNNIITEVDTLGYASQLVLSSLGTAVIFCVYLATSLYISFKMTLIASLCFVPLLIIQRRFNRKAYITGEEIYLRHESLFSAVSEFISSFKIAKSYNLQDKYVAEFRSITRQTSIDNFEFSKIQASTSMLYGVGSALIICAILVWAVEVAKMPGVDLLLMIYVATKLLPNLSTLTRNFQYAINTLPSYLGVTKLLDEATENEETTRGAASPEFLNDTYITLSNIHFGYDEDPPIFSNLNCKIPINKTTSILGESGKGKSTLIELLLGLLKPQAGQILINGVDLNNANLMEWRNATAYIPQECFLFNASIRQNLLWSKPDATEEDLREALHSAAGEFVYNLPHGLETIVGDQGIRLSGGERQRIALARALLRKPKILILDEATNALDLENETLIKQAIDKLKWKTTIILISHDHLMSEGADQVIKIG
jgi:ATP-binding cassette, subfamily C, bacterial